ncbi:MAG: hypothetical protein JSU94_08750, partial [Phycisphaerales bacterium]
ELPFSQELLSFLLRFVNTTGPLGNRRFHCKIHSIYSTTYYFTKPADRLHTTPCGRAVRGSSAHFEQGLYGPLDEHTLFNCS